MKTTTFETHPFKAARKAGVPILAIETPDPVATVRSCAITRNGKPDDFLIWDCIKGLRAHNEKDSSAKAKAESIGQPIDTQNLVACLDRVANVAPEECSIFLHNAQAAFADITALQAVWNCRDVLKSSGSCLVLMGPALKLPPELANDVPVFEEPIPTEADVDSQIESALKAGKKASEKFADPTPEERTRIHDTLRGYLSMFAIEQALSLSSKASGLDLRRLWELKVASLKNTAGLEISQPSIAFPDLAGCYGVKEFFGRLIKGRQPVRGVFFLDEIEKMLAGNQGDTSGTSQALVEQFLYWTEAKKVLAVLLLGVPGGGKSHTAACVAGEAKVPLLRGSMSTVKGSLVGQSEANMQRLLKTVDSVTQESTLLIATCNSLSSLTPEILARFKLGVFFYDYPTTEEAKALWDLYRSKYQITDPIPEGCAKWVGREIESCCHRAWLFNCKLDEAARTVVPVSRANGAKMEALRESASGKFLAAAVPGIYEKNTQAQSGSGRTLSL